MAWDAYPYKKERTYVLPKKKLLSNFQKAKLEKCDHFLAIKENIISFKSHPLREDRVAWVGAL